MLDAFESNHKLWGYGIPKNLLFNGDVQKGGRRLWAQVSLLFFFAFTLFYFDLINSVFILIWFFFFIISIKINHFFILYFLNSIKFDCLTVLDDISWSKVAGLRRLLLRLEGEAFRCMCLRQVIPLAMRVNAAHLGPSVLVTISTSNQRGTAPRKPADA